MAYRRHKEPLMLSLLLTVRPGKSAVRVFTRSKASADTLAFEPLRITEHQEHCVGLPPEVIATLYLLDGAVEDAERLYCKPQHQHGWLDVQASRLAQQLCIVSAEDVASLTQLALQLVSLYEDDDYPRGLEMIPTGHYPCWGITNCAP
jgi:hypothetical protein